MIVCHCQAINDKALAPLLADGLVREVDDLTSRCGAGGVCGGCRPALQWMIDRAARERAGTEARVAIGSPA